MPKVFNRAIKLVGENRTINGVTVRVKEYDENGDISKASGVTLPTAGDAGYAKGCLFTKTDAATGLGSVYENQGTSTSASFGAVGSAGAVANLLTPFIPDVVQQALSGAGVVNLTTFYTAVTSTGADALTLADSTVKGQLKKVQLIVDGGDATLTFNTNATIVFADAGDYAVLMWNGADWIPVELGNDADGATAPAYTPAS